MSEEYTLKEFEIGKLSLKPGDILVVKSPGRLDANAREFISKDLVYMLKISGMDNKIIVLEQGMDINVLVKESKG